MERRVSPEPREEMKHRQEKEGERERQMGHVIGKT